jgi:hypothetical protein
MTQYEVRCGRRAVAVRTATTAHEALADYLRSLGCQRNEIARVGADAAAWRGAVYSAVPADGDTKVGRSSIRAR